MAAAVYYLCPHTAPISAVPPHRVTPTASLLGLDYFPLPSLLFCEECDAIRCDQCVSVELSCYYCPNCLFEVPSANIRAQKNRCGRNCFVCPQCQNTLAAVATDPPASSYQDDPKAPQASVGEPPYFLTCTFCRWDSKQVGISFEKPTFLAQQLQQAESSTPELLEFERLKDHLETYLKSQNHVPSASTPHRTGMFNSTSSAQLAASLALSKEIPTVSRYGTQLGLTSSVFKIRSAHSVSSSNVLPTNVNPDGTWKEDLGFYEALFPVGGPEKTPGNSIKREDARFKLYQLGDRDDDTSSASFYADELAPLEKKCGEVWECLDRTRDLKPTRVPLRCKRTKRCPTCQHILIKPEQKAQSIRFKVKLIASNYLPLIELQRKRLITPGKHLMADRLTSGVSAARKSATSRASAASGSNLPQPIISKDPEEQYTQFPYTVHLLASEFTIAAFAEVWEYDEEDDDEGENDNDEHGDPAEVEEAGAKRNRLSTFGITDSSRRRTFQPNPAVTKKANRTTILVEVKTTKHFAGLLQADMLVTFTYRSDELEDDLDDSSPLHSRRKNNLGDGEDPDDENQKSFTFWTKLTFGEVVPGLPTLTPGSSAQASGTKKKKSTPSPLSG